MFSMHKAIARQIRATIVILFTIDDSIVSSLIIIVTISWKMCA